MAGPISQQLEDLLNPLPKFTDPEDDHDEGMVYRLEYYHILIAIGCVNSRACKTI